MFLIKSKVLFVNSIKFKIIENNSSSVYKQMLWVMETTSTFAYTKHIKNASRLTNRMISIDKYVRIRNV